MRREKAWLRHVNDLKEFKFFKGFTDAQLEKLAAMAVEESYEAGTQMYKKGDPARSLFMCQEGKVVMVMDNYMGPQRTPMQITVDIITRGESMGWSAVVEPYLYTLGALCIDNCRLIALDAAKLRALMDDDCELGLQDHAGHGQGDRQPADAYPNPAGGRAGTFSSDRLLMNSQKLRIPSASSPPAGEGKMDFYERHY